MLCRRCEARAVHRGGRSGALAPARLWGAERLGGLLCAYCGGLLATEELVTRVLEKESQLAQFGLAGLWRPLLEASRPRGH